jgi:hypothetical protein
MAADREAGDAAAVQEDPEADREGVEVHQAEFQKDLFREAIAVHITTDAEECILIIQTTVVLVKRAAGM